MSVCQTDFTGSLALITGASRGIGYFLSLELARSGAHVLALARSSSGLKSLEDEVHSFGGKITAIPLDLSDAIAIDQLGDWIKTTWNKLDIFVGNAGILGTLSAVTDLDPQIISDVFKINCFSNWRLIRALSSLLLKSKNGRAVFLSSSVAQSARPYWSAYAASKAALEIFVRSWAQEMAHTSLRINLIDPGATCTKMRAQAMPNEDPTYLQHPKEVAEKIKFFLLQNSHETEKIFKVKKKRFL